MKKNRNPKEVVNNLMENLKEDNDMIDFEKIKLKYLNNFWPVKKGKKQQIIKNSQNRKELEILIEDLSKREPLFWEIDILKNKSISLKDKDKNYNADESIVKYYDINNNLLKEKIFYMNLIEQQENCKIF